MILCVKPDSYELVIKKSRFIAYSYAIERRDDVKPIVDALKAEHRDARHVCYAFVADEKGMDFGYDDNGEPSGTAGKPIYSAIEASGAKKSLIAVVRYFGGIKLGAGGLTRAYRQAAAELIDKSGLAKAERYAVYEAQAPSDAFKRVSAAIRNIGGVIDNIMYYGETVGFRATVLPAADIISALGAFSVAPRKLEEKYVYLAE